RGSARFINAGRAAREDQAARPQLRDPRRRQIMADELAEDILLAHPPGNELAVLGAEVEDQDPFIFGQWRHVTFHTLAGVARHLKPFLIPRTAVSPLRPRR